jgi:hypothetical protein
LFVLLLAIPASSSWAQQSADGKKLAEYIELKKLTPSDLQELLPKAYSGDAKAQFLLGQVYAEDRLVAKDLAESAKWFLKSAEQNFVPAERRYGLTLAHTNPPVGERWMLRAAEQGDTDAQLWLGFAYEHDWFGTTDPREALKWYRLAADGGDPDAQVTLGQKYLDGEDVEMNYELAAKWFKKAAEHVPDLGGAGQGRRRLGLLYTEGLGVPRDFAQAYFWFSLNRPEPDGDAVEAKSHLNSVQTREVERLIREWHERHRLSPEVASALHLDN